MIEKVNLAQKFSLFDECWSPRIAGELNDSHVKLVKLKGEFVWHHHADEDELFLVHQGSLVMEFRDRPQNDATRRVEVRAGEFIVVPRGVEHRPVAENPCSVLLFEPAGTLNTGDAQDARTVRNPERL